MDIEILDKSDNEIESYNSLKGQLFYLNNSINKEFIDINTSNYKILNKIIIIKIPKDGTIIIKQTNYNERYYNSKLKDIYKIIKQGLTNSFINNIIDICFKLFLIIICIFIFSTNCNKKEKEIEFKDLKTLLINKNIETQLNNEDLELIFLKVYENLILRNKIEYFEDKISNEFKKFLLLKNEKHFLIDIFIQILSIFQPIMDYSLPYLLSERNYIFQWNLISPFYYFLGRIFKAFIEQIIYNLILLLFLNIVSNGIFNLIDYSFMFIYANLSFSTYILISSFINKKKFFYFLIIIHLYTNLLSYQSIGDQFELIDKNYRLNIFTKIFSYYFLLFPSTNFQAYFYHKCIENQIKLVLKEKYHYIDFLKVQVWGMNITEFKCLEVLLVLGIINFFLILFFSALNFSYQMR